MTNVVPAYLYPFVLLGAVAVIAAVFIGARRVLMPAKTGIRSVTALFLAWFFAALGSAWCGFYDGGSSRIPTIQYGLLIPIAAGVLLYLRWPALKLLVDRAPQRFIVTMQVYRVMGLIFLVLYATGLLPPAFALPAGVGDVIVGLAAPFVELAYARGARASAALLRAWNLVGLADLVVAVTTGFLTSPSPLQLLALDRPNRLITVFPLVMVPVFLVPLAVLLHLASLQKLRAGQPSATLPGRRTVTALRTSRPSPHRAPDHPCPRP